MKYLNNDIIVCRCEEVTVGEIRQAIKEGATDIVGVKMRVRAGMGLCQGKTCEKMVMQIICEELKKGPDEVGYSSIRLPVKPVTFGALSKSQFDNELEVSEF